MKIAYAFRRTAFYPYQGGTGWEIPPREVRARYLRRVREAGFEGLEVGLGQGVARDEAGVRELRRELEDAGLPCAALRGGGGFAAPRLAAQNRQRMEEAIRTAAWIGADLVNMALTTPTGHPAGQLGGGVGLRTSPGASRVAGEADFAVTARHIREAAALAADLGVTISLELHQHSLADNAWSCLHLLELIDRPNVGVNPDLGNLYWHYEEPEETPEACIVALAPRAKYWHCKQLQRLHIPETERAYFQPVPLPDGELDYRFAIAAMRDAGYDGYLAIEGCRDGDQLYRDARSVSYCREVLRDLAAADQADG
ncbi:MAG TPA: sugar phosphate isomerase/epimerase [Thermomicrobiales bacterium]|nr:sugar phosphate isomerase/epimerase [Thermomicrobiales bacterium]